PADPLGWETRLQGCLNQLLRNGPQPSADVMHEGQYKGFSPKQIRATAFRMGVEIRKRPGFGKDGGWEWSFPGTAADARNVESLENAGRNVKNHVWALDATGDAEERTTAAPSSSRDSAVDLESPAPLESASRHASAQAKATDAQNAESLEKAAGNAKSVVVALAATDREEEQTTAAPPSSIDSMVDLESPAPVESASHQTSAEANATEESLATASAQNSESLENAAKTGVSAPVPSLTKRERRRQARRERKLIRKARERGVEITNSSVQS
ncbi:MAG: hypothetical protein JSS02_05895, partial [Planctomycetes bacterium]|nr:hypothetical protein [Planctomycetota bacterium]